MILIELLPAWLVYLAFSLGILTMMGAVVLSGLAIYYFWGEDRKREADEAMRYADELGPYPWGLYQSDD
jgi:hypothetical protein